MTVDGTKTTMAALRKGLLIETGIKHTFVVDLVRVYVEWPEDLVRRLPDDFVLTLTISGEPKQVLAKAAATPAQGEMMRFEFEWDDKTKSVKLEASSNEQTILLWRDHVAGDLGLAVAWDKRLDPLLAEHEKVEIAGQATEAGQTPDDLRHEDFDAFLRGLI
jgi:hypothetical protein